MRKTKKLILDTALELFNEQGLSTITLRKIALEMGISQGNLNYHFKKREDIIEALYFQLVHQIDEQFTLANRPDSLLQVLFNISNVVMKSFYEYRFIFLDFVQIIRENNSIKNHYIKLMEEREGQFMQLFDLLINEGFLRESILENEYNNLYKRTQIIADFWISSAMVTQDHMAKDSLMVYAKIINQSIFPYLTEKGRTSYYAISKSLIE